MYRLTKSSLKTPCQLRYASLTLSFPISTSTPSHIVALLPPLANRFSLTRSTISAKEMMEKRGWRLLTKTSVTTTLLTSSLLALELPTTMMCPVWTSVRRRLFPSPNFSDLFPFLFPRQGCSGPPEHSCHHGRRPSRYQTRDWFSHRRYHHRLSWRDRRFRQLP